MPFKVAVTFSATTDNPIQNLSRHASETDLEIMFLNFHIDEDGWKRTDKDSHVRIMLLCQSDQAFKNLLFGLEHAVYLLNGKVDIMVAIIDVGIDHVGGTEEMEYVSM